MKTVLVSVYVLSGLAAGVGGLITAGMTNTGSPTFGELSELDSIAAVIIGGAASPAAAATSATPSSARSRSA